MFHDMWNAPISGTASLPETPPTETELLRQLERLLRTYLPSAWQATLTPATEGQNRGPDAWLTIQAPDGAQATFVVEVKSGLPYPADVPSLVAQLRLYARPGEEMLLIAPFLSPRVQSALAEAGVGYLDATGNLRLAPQRLALYLQRTGAPRNPWKEPRPAPLQSLRGVAAARVVRALCDFRPPYGIRELAERTGNAPSSVSRVVGLLEREALLTRDKAGSVLTVRWRALIERWAQDYGLTRSNATVTYLEPRGLDALLRKLPQVSLPYVVTGSLAAVRVVPFAPPRLATLFVSEISQAAETLGVRRAERGSNVLLVAPLDAVVFARAVEHQGIRYAAFSQIAADLLTSPGRGPEEAGELLEWMEVNEDAWRSALT